MWLLIWNRILTSPITKYVVAGIVIIFIVIGIVMHFTAKYKTTIDRLEYNTKVSDTKLKVWTNKFGDVVVEKSALMLTQNEFRNSTNETINTLKSKLEANGVKIKKLEYALSVETDFNADSIVPIITDTLHTNDSVFIVQRLDSLTIGDFKLIRVELNNASHYNISYKPTLYIGISHYKDGKWRLRNLFHKRDIRYKVIISSSDKMLKPKDIQIIKID